MRLVSSLAFQPQQRHLWRMHRRLVFEEPVSRAALWSRRLAWFSLAVLLLALLVFRTGEPSLQGLAPVALDHLVQIIDSLRAQGLAVLLAEQNHAFAARLGDRFVALRAGEIVARGDRSQLADRELAAVAMMGQSTPTMR